MQMFRAILGAACALAVTSVAPAAPYLYAWASHSEPADGGFLAVIDVDPASATYGELVSTAPTGTNGGSAHHIEYEMPDGTTLFANDWGTANNFVIDLADPRRPRIAATFDRAGDFSYAHSFARLPNGNVVATFQSIGASYAPPGGLVELDANGRPVRSARSATADIPTAINWPYSLAVVPAADRIVTTSTDMGRGKDWKSPETRHVQIWSLSAFKLLSSVALPEAPESAGKANLYPAEPRVLADGTVYVNTFSCGLFRLDGLTGGKPAATFVHAFPSGPGPHDICSVPLVYGKYWIQTVGAINGLVVLDVSNPASPREVSRLVLPGKFHGPHWVAADRSRGKIAATGMKDGWIAMLRFDETSGALSIDEAFGEGGAITFKRDRWPHGAKSGAIVHGVLFSRR